MTASASSGKGLNKESARTGLDRLQVGIGILLLLAATAGVYLLATDGSLWNLALSHALGLIVIVAVDLVVGFASLLSRRSVYVPSLAAAALGVVLQLGDILTAPQYYQTVQYFAGYLFGLWAFDLMLAVQFLVLFLGLRGRRQAAFLARRRSRRGRELEYSRRGFVKSIGAFGALVGFVALLSSIKLPVSSNALTTTTAEAGAPTGSIAKVSSLKVGTPIYFEYPAGYPNLLKLQKDGTLVAVSMLCTHVCCQLEYDPGYDEFGCPCHGSVFDTSGAVLQGPANVSLPKVSLRTDSNGYVYPTGVDNPGPCQV